MAYSTVAAFFFGVGLGPLILNDPTLQSRKGDILPSLDEASIKSRQYTLRSADGLKSGDLIEILFSQNDSQFERSASILSADPFSFIIKSPISGSLTVSELSGDSNAGFCRSHPHQ